MSDTTVIVADAHLRAFDSGAVAAFHRFLERVPDLGDHLVLNGDIFDFWFEYRRVVLRQAFPTLAALLRLRRAGIRLTVVGGNHDRWGGGFWRDELSAEFAAGQHTMVLSGRRALVAHGDGLVDRHPGARFFGWLTRRRLTIGLFRWLHPDLSLPLVDRLSRRLGQETRAPDVIESSAVRQEEWARVRLGDDRTLDLVVLAHTHHPALVEVEPGRWYVNPGAWMEGNRYALVGPDGPSLHTFAEGSG